MHSRLATYILFLRGVMPTGKNKVPMAELKKILSEDGFIDVQTWIQSGNVVVKTALAREEIADTVSKLIEEKIGAQIPIIVLTHKELLMILKENPFDNNKYDSSRIFFSLYNATIDALLKTQLQETDFHPEELRIGNQVAYMYIPGTYGRGKLSNTFFEKKAKIIATSRNANTLRKMIEMTQSL